MQSVGAAAAAVALAPRLNTRLLLLVFENTITVLYQSTLRQHRIALPHVRMRALR